MPGPAGISREELVGICEAAIRREDVWSNRDSEAAHRQLGECWALVKAGCDFSVTEDADGRFLQVRTEAEGFDYFEYGTEASKRCDDFYVPTEARLLAIGEESDWYG